MSQQNEAAFFVRSFGCALFILELIGDMLSWYMTQCDFAKFMVLHMIFAIITGIIARFKGRSFWGYFCLSLFTSKALGLLIIICLPSRYYYVSEEVNIDQEIEDTHPSGDVTQSSVNPINKNVYICRSIYVHNEHSEGCCQVCKSVNKLSKCVIHSYNGIEYKDLCSECIKQYRDNIIDST